MADDFDKVIMMLNKQVTRLRDKENLREIGTIVKEQVKKRTRLGKGVSENLGRQESLTIKPSTQKRRQRLKNQGGLTGPTTPKKANLTRTGKLIDSIRIRVSKDSVTVTPSNDQKKKAQYLADQGKKFMFITKGEFKDLLRFLTNKLLKGIK